MPSGVCVCVCMSERGRQLNRQTEELISSTDDVRRLQKQVLCRLSASLLEDILSNAVFPSWDGVIQRFCVFPGQWETRCVYHGMMGKNQDRGRNHQWENKYGAESYWQETGFEPKQLDKLRNTLYMRDRVCCLSERLFHCREEKCLLNVTVVHIITTRGGDKCTFLIHSQILVFPCRAMLFVIFFIFVKT